eukprot:COSAG01_NODE_1925_length_8884_cov_6.366648_7_plen_59_part_00
MSTASDPLRPPPASHSLAPDGSAARELTAAVRCSPHYFNTEQEVDRAVAAVATILADA